MSDLILPPGTRLIHIGPHKTGSTAIQSAMHAHRDVLLEHGVHYASGAGPRAKEAGWAILGGRAPIGRPEPRMEKWEDLVHEVRGAGDLRVANSNEDYGRATPDQIKRIVGELGGGKPHVVAVVRRLDRFFPSMWQERIKARETRTYDDWLRVILSEKSDDWQWDHIWYPCEVRGLVERWTDQVGKENMTLIVADEQDRALLPRSFEQLLGLPSGTLDMQGLRSNRSLTRNEVELVRRVNLLSREKRWPDWAYAQFVQGGGVVKALQTADRPAGDGSVAAVPDWARERITQLAAEQAAGVRESGVRVIGDPDRLEQVEPPASERSVEIMLDVETAARVVDSVVAKSLRLRKPDGDLRATGSAAFRTDSRTVAETSGRELIKVLGSRAVGRLRRR